MICKKCGMEITSDAKFCKNCGSAVEKEVNIENGHRTNTLNNNEKRVLSNQEKSILFAPILLSVKKIQEKQKIIESLPFRERIIFELLGRIELQIKYNAFVIAAILILGFWIVVTCILEGQWWR